MLRFLLEKEFKQLLRNPFMVRLLIVFPLMLVAVIPWVVTMDIKEIRVAVVDSDRSQTSRKLIRKVGASDYFRLTAAPASYGEAIRMIEYGTTDIVFEIPADFESDLARTGAATVQISANSVNGTRGALGGGYLSQLVQEFAAEQLRQKGARTPDDTATAPRVSVDVKNLFNEPLDSKRNTVPGFMVMLLVLLCGFLPTLNIVGEKEHGTIDQMNVTPVSRFTFILAKLVPYWIMGLLALSEAFLLAKLVYGLSPAGNLATIYLGAALFILSMTGLGVVVSNYSSTMQQAMFVMWFLIMICVLMSGILTPVTSMPRWAQWIAACTPPRHMVTVLRSVYLKGSAIPDLLPQFVTLAAMAVATNAAAVISYRKSS